MIVRYELKIPSLWKLRKIVEAQAIKKMVIGGRRVAQIPFIPSARINPESLKTNVWPILSPAKVFKMHGFHGNP